jgi:hypothetical protein
VVQRLRQENRVLETFISDLERDLDGARAEAESYRRDLAAARAEVNRLGGETRDDRCGGERQESTVRNQEPSEQADIDARFCRLEF